MSKISFKEPKGWNFSICPFEVSCVCSHQKLSTQETLQAHHWFLLRNFHILSSVKGVQTFWKKIKLQNVFELSACLYKRGELTLWDYTMAPLSRYDRDCNDENVCIILPVVRCLCVYQVSNGIKRKNSSRKRIS